MVSAKSVARAMLRGQVALVTGASRGIGKGIALQLGQAGATVYVTGRSPDKQESISATLKLPSLNETAREITARGGKGIAIYCDHSDPDDIKRLFLAIAKDQNNRLDILVNNAYAAVNAVSRATGVKFWDLDPSLWDTVNNVGLKNHYICSVYAAKLMVPQRKGLIVTVSSAGGMRYLFNAAYGAGKAACDRLAADMAHELIDHGITSVSLWPGPVRTEVIERTILAKGRQLKERGGGISAKETVRMFEEGESLEYAGKCVVALVADKDLIKKTGKILTTTDLAQEYNVTEDDTGAQPKDPLVIALGRKYLDPVNEVRAPKPKSKY